MTAQNKATPARKRGAAKVASPARQAADEVAGKTAAADLTAVGARPRAATRTATGGAGARTATRPRARTAAAADAVTVEPTEVLPADGSPAAAEPERPDEGGAVEEVDVVWRGRTIRVRLPNLEQMTIYKRLSRNFAALADRDKDPRAEPMTLDEATGHYDRAIKLITSVMVNRADVEWLEDELLERNILLPDAADLMKEAIGKLGDANEQAGNRQERRKASRKARLGD